MESPERNRATEETVDSRRVQSLLQEKGQTFKLKGQFALFRSIMVYHGVEELGTLPHNQQALQTPLTTSPQCFPASFLEADGQREPRKLLSEVWFGALAVERLPRPSSPSAFRTRTSDILPPGSGQECLRCPIYWSAHWLMASLLRLPFSLLLES